MYAQNPMFSGVSPGRMAEARRFAQGGQMGRARQQFELGGGQWNPQVQRMIGQQDNIGQMIPGPGGPPPAMGGGMAGGHGGGMGGPQEQIGGGIGGPQDMVQPGGPGGSPWGAFPGMGGGPGDMRAAVLRPGDKFWEPGMGGEMGGPPQWGAFPGMGGGMGRPPMPPPQFQGRPPAGNWGGQGGGFEAQRFPYRPGGMGGRPPAGPPGLRRMVQY